MSNQLSAKLIDLDGNLLEFYCPGCMMVHHIAVRRPNSVGAMWTWDGHLERPTFSPSVLVKMAFKEPKICHSYIRNGMIEYLGDCTHHLKGHTVELPDIPPDWL